MRFLGRICGSDEKFHLRLNLRSGEALRICGEARTAVGICIFGNGAIRSRGIRNDAELPLNLNPPIGRAEACDKDLLAGCEPRRVVKHAAARISEIRARAGGCVDGNKSADVIEGWLHDGNCDGFSVGRPGERVAVAGDGLTLEKSAFGRAVRFRDQQIERRRIVILAQICEMLSVGGKRDGTVDIANQNAWRASEDGRFVQNRNGVFGFIATDKIKVAAIGRKCDSDIARGGRRYNLRVASRLDVAKLKRLQTVLVEDEREVFSVGRNRGESSVAVVREIFDGEMLEGKVHGLVRKGESENAVARGE